MSSSSAPGRRELGAAIRLKQLNPELSIVVVEKGSEVGAHILSGAVMDPVALDKLVPDWREDADCPLKTQVKDDRFFWMTKSGAIRLPNFMMPPLMNNHHCYIGSLGQLCRWLAGKAEALGVEIYPGFAAVEVLYDDKGAVRGIATGDMGVAKDGSHKASFTRGMELCGKYTLFAEGARGSLTKQLIAKFTLDAKSEPGKFGIGLKEVWQIDPSKHQKGLTQHSFGWPLGNKTGGGSFLYHYDDNLVAVGFVVHLNYDDPYLSPFEEFQRFKTHPAIRPLFEGGKRLAYGARAITEGGYQSVPRLSFAGGALIGCAAGFVTCRASRAFTMRSAAGCWPPNRSMWRLPQVVRTTSLSNTKMPGVRRLSARICFWFATSNRSGRNSAPSWAWRSAASTCGAIRSASRCLEPSRMPSPTARRSIRQRSMRRLLRQSRTAN